MAENVFINRILENDGFKMADVEIIIPFHGEHNHVVKLIDSIFKTVFSNRYLITLVDDFSPNKHFIDKFKKVSGIRSFRLSEHKGFGAAINHALNNPWKFNDNRSKIIPYVCIMHSDVVPEGQWLLELGKTLLNRRSDGIKMVSSLTDNSTTSFDVLTGKIGKEDKILLDPEFLPMYCSLMHRELFNKIGLFKEYPYAGFEAQEFAQRMNKNGFKQAVCGQSWVHHIGGATLSKFTNNEKVKQILRNTQDEFLKTCDKTVNKESLF